MDKFLEALDNELKRNKDLELNIPFLLSVVTQSFELNKDAYKDFMSDLDKYHEWNINVDKSQNTYNSICDITVNLFNYLNEDEYGFSVYDELGYHYLFTFEYDERNWGYCECSPNDNDYREDKKCCGHGCDWSAPAFSLYKVVHIASDSWNGDEHDYWDFEDEYYKNDEESNKRKKEKEREMEIMRLKATIEAANNRLAEIQ